MNPVWAAFLGTLIVQLVIAAFVYGRLTERVKAVDDRTVDYDTVKERVNTVNDRTVDHGRRVTNLETVLSGTGGHGERLTALEAWRIESRENKHS